MQRLSIMPDPMQERKAAEEMWQVQRTLPVGFQRVVSTKEKGGLATAKFAKGSRLPKLHQVGDMALLANELQFRKLVLAEEKKIVQKKKKY